jgi:hypothetical protein
MLKQQSVEHRWGRRFDIDVPAMVTSRDGGSAAVRISNASISGARVETDIFFPAFTRVIVQPQRATAPGIEAFVVRPATGGFAVEWAHPGAETLAHLLADGAASTKQKSAS